MQYSPKLSKSVPPYVVALDVGSTASRGGLYDAHGRPVRDRKFKIPHEFITDASGKSEISAEQVATELATGMDQILTPDLEGKIGGVILDTFASSLVVIDEQGHPLTNCITYADARSAPQLATLRTEIDEAAHQQKTGTRLHTSYLPPRLLWLAQEKPDTFAKAAKFYSLGEYVYHRLAGAPRLGVATAAWAGMIDRRTAQWDTGLIERCGIRPDQLGEIHFMDDPLTQSADHTADRWPVLRGVPWYPVIADGLASNIGVGATDESTIAASGATSGAMRVLLHSVPESIPSGLWCYRVDRNRSLLGGALNDVGRVVTWLESTFVLPDDGDRAAILAAPPREGTPVVLPYLTGERSTGWVGRAKATLTDVTVAAGGREFYRGAMEGVSVTYARVLEQLQAAAGSTERIVVSGRVTLDLPDWLQIFSDVLEAPVIPISMKRATLHGTALMALEQVSPDTVKVPMPAGGTYTPRPGSEGYYRRLKARFQEVYGSMVSDG